MFAAILLIYALIARTALRAISRRQPGLLPWAWLLAISLALGGMVSMFLALAMIGKGGSHVDYCPNLPAGHLLECMPSVDGVYSATLVAASVATVVFATGALILGGARVLTKKLGS